MEEIIAQTIEQIIIEIKKENQTEIDSIDHNLHLFDNAVLDSLDTLNLIERINEKYSITLDDEDVFNEDFTTLNGISKIIRNKINQ